MSPAGLVSFYFFLSLWRFHSTDSERSTDDCYATQANNPFGGRLNESESRHAGQESRMEEDPPGTEYLADWLMVVQLEISG